MGDKPKEATEVTVTKQVIDDPVAFSRAILKTDLWQTQIDIMNAIKTRRRVAVKACHASGKTYIAGRATLWWLARYPEGIVITTAPGWGQVERVLWGEIRSAVHRSKQFWPRDAQLLRTEFRISEGNYAVGFSTDEGVRFQGYHGRILVIIDEAAGVHPQIWEAIEGIRAGGHVTVLALANPTVPGGNFYDAFRSDSWTTFTISAFDTPNLAGLTLEQLLAMPDEDLDINERDYLVSRRWVKEKYQEWGPDSPQWQARVMGEFPEQDSSSLFALSHLEWARREPKEDSGGTVYAGLDVAGEGSNRSVLVIREGGSILKTLSWSLPDPKLHVLAALEPYQERLGAVVVDASGMGYHLVMRLREAGIPTVGIRGEVAPNSPEIFLNKRAELYFKLRTWFEHHRITGLSNEAMYKQLSLIRTRPAEQVRGRLAIESKEEMKRRGVESPDFADALVLACAVDRPANINPPGGGAMMGSEGIQNRTVQLRGMRLRR